MAEKSNPEDTKKPQAGESSKPGDEDKTKMKQSSNRELMVRSQEAHENLRETGKNNVEHLVRWMIDSNLVLHDEEKNARQMFDHCVDKNNVEANEFMEVLARLKEGQDKSADGFTAVLAEHAPRIDDTIKAFDKAFRDAIGR